MQMNLNRLDYMAEPLLCSGFGSFHSDTGKNPKPLASITLGEILHMIDNPQQVDKAEAQWLIPSTLHSRTFKEQEQNGTFWMLLADLDKNPPALDHLQDVLRDCLAGSDFEVYSSRSATADCPKWHVLIPLAKPLSGADWCLAQEVLNDHLQQDAGIEPDRATERAAQLCYLPNRGAFYQTHSRRKGQPFDALDALAFGADIASKRAQQAAEAEALRLQREAAKARREARTASGDNPDTIGAFNLSFTVDEVLQQAGYDQRGKTFRHPHSESGSYSASVKDGRVHALSPNDPLYSDGKGAHDAFSAFEVLFHRGDRKAALKDAGDNWLTIRGESWNKAKQREYAQAQAGATVADFDSLLAAGGVEPKQSLQEVDLSDVMSSRLEPVRFAVAPWFPKRHVTLFGGHGGIGKSTLALAVAAHVAAGIPFAGMDVEQSPVLFVSLEDEPMIVRLRLRRVIEAYGLPADVVLGNLRLLDGTHGAAALMTAGAGSNDQPLFTGVYRELVRRSEGAGLIFVDNASDAFEANENARRDVRLFVRGLARIARGSDAALVLLAHIDKAAAKNGAQGNSYSGSTAWHNSARSRIALVIDDDNGAISVLHEKANLGPKAEPLAVSFSEHGIPMPEGRTSAAGVAGLTPADFDKAEMLRAFKAAAEAGITVPASTVPSQHSAMTALANLPEYGAAFKRGKQGNRRAAAAITALLRNGQIEKEVYRKPNRHDAERLILSRSERAEGQR
jgi:hypothetical protein